MIRHGRFRTFAVLCCVLLTVGACGTSKAGSSAVKVTGDPVAGGAGRVMALTEPRTLDPVSLVNSWQTQAFVGNAIFGTLLVNDPRTGEVKPSMAESFDSADRGSTFTLKLRPGLTFSDGRPLDAAAVKFNWDRHKDPANGSGYLPEMSLVASTEAVDAATLLVRMGAPVPNFPSAMLVSSLNWIGSPAALQAGRQAFDAKPIGAGPYVLASWARQDRMELTRNPRYWDAPKPYLDSLTIRVSNDQGQRYNTLVSGGADVVLETNSGSIAKAEKAGYPTDVALLSGGLFLALNMRRAPFDDLRARQAVAAAIDIDALNQAVYNGTGHPVRTLFADTSPLYADMALRTPDRATAQRLFDELAAEGKPVSFAFTTFTSAEIRATAESVQAQLNTFAGVTVRITQADFAQNAALQASGDFDMLVWSASFIDPDPRLSTAFASTSRGNFPGIKDPQLDAALQAGRTATTAAERKSAYATVQERLVALTPAIFTDRPTPAVMASRNVGGIAQYGLGSLLPAEMWIKP